MSIRVRSEHQGWPSWREGKSDAYQGKRWSVIHLGTATAASVMEGKPGHWVLASDFPMSGDGPGVESMYKWEAEAVEVE